MVGVEAALAGIEVAQGVDAQGAPAEEAGQGVGVLEVAVEAPAEDAGDRRVSRVNFSHQYGRAACRESPGQQNADVAPVGGGETATAGACVVAARGRQFRAGPVDRGKGCVPFDGGVSLAM